LGIVAAAYFGLGPGIYRKTGGRLPLSTQFVMAPVLIGQHLSLAHYRSQCRAWNELTPGLWIGRVLRETEAEAAIAQGVTAVLDLTTEFSEPAPFRAANYRNLPILDLTTPNQDQLAEAVAFIVDEAARGLVYVHCKAGYSRTAAVAGAYLLASGEAATVEEAIARLREVRPTIVVRSEAEEALRTFAHAEKSTLETSA
jgi:protein-tyrosine phosphatase